VFAAAGNTTERKHLRSRTNAIAASIPAKERLLQMTRCASDDGRPAAV
jgi:hypothetical protein